MAGRGGAGRIVRYLGKLAEESEAIMRKERDCPELVLRDGGLCSRRLLGENQSQSIHSTARFRERFIRSPPY